MSVSSEPLTMASEEELRELLKNRRPKSPLKEKAKPTRRRIELKRDEGYSSDPDGAAIEFPSPLHMLAALRPELEPYKWQAETLLQFGGFLDPTNLAQRTLPTTNNPFLLCFPAANGSGKDLVLIAAFAVWFALKGLKNFVFITSSSYEQIRSQTNPHIRDLCNVVNKRLGNIFRSVENYHVCTQTASEIKLYVTDEAGRAEGYHPRFGGEMALIFNEAKSIDEDLWSAYSRCTGYSYWLEISSPGGKSGHFYDSSRAAVCYPEKPILGRYYLRHVTAYDCPHIPASHIALTKDRESKEWFDSSVLALFTDYGQSNPIKESLWDSRYSIYPPTDSRYAIGGDLAAGGDECSFYLRRGPNIVDELHFRQKDTTVTAEIFDTKFHYVKAEPNLIVRLDDGGVGHAIIDNLVKMGWVIQRIHNQAAALNKREFLNRGAEMYFHLSRLLAGRLINSPGIRDAKLRKQITSRIADNLNGGKYRLEPKKDHIARTRESPDRADAYVLCYSSYPLIIRGESRKESQPTMQKLSLEEFEEQLTWGTLARKLSYGNHTGKHSYIRRI